ncbi:S1 RNA-binding domain-containing protein [Candidatus Woesearchaeota archaeon]|nr:S1 RNA-binding domain-containing protein [Candidatus Woesearchaeota archaeon]
MFYRKKDLPQEYEIVMCTITKIQYHSVFATIDEYDLKGMIHISEVAAGRIRNINEYIKEGKVVVCMVLRIDQERGHIDLSLRRVTDMQRKTKINEMKLEQIAEKIIEVVAHTTKRDVRQVYEHIATPIFKKYSYLHKFFEQIVAEIVDVKELNIPKEYEKILVETVKQRIKQPEVTIKGDLHFKTYESNGLEIITHLFQKLTEYGKKAVDIKYAGAGIYKIIVKQDDYKKAEAIIKEMLEIVKKSTKNINSQYEFIRAETK